METYWELVKQDVCLHEPFEDASSRPSRVSLFVQSLKNALKLPRWLKSGPAPFTNARAVSLLDQLPALDAPNADLWDNAEETIDEVMEQKLRVVLDTALVDCARIQAVVEAEDATGTPYPKESFLVILARNAILNAHAWLAALEGTPVVLPRHFSGEAIPILKYMAKSFYVPLVISICQDMPVEESNSELEYQDDEDSSVESESFRYSPPTLSEFLDGCGWTPPPEEVEEEEETFLSTHFEAHFYAYSSSATPPSTCHIPVLCMADEEQLPVLMSSLLYQRRVWHIDDPLIGLSFSKYDTAIRIFVGWLEDELPLDRVLPRVHLGEITAPVALDLSSPSAAVVISRLVCSLEPYILAVCDSIRNSVGAVVNETQSHSPFAWRIDTDIQRGESASVIGNNGGRDMVSQWVKSQKYSELEGMPPRRKQGEKISLSGSGTSMPPPQKSTPPSTQRSYPASPLSFASKEGSLQVPEVREPLGSGDSVPTFCSRLSCSAFAATTEIDHYRVFRWMFDRRVIPQSIPFASDFREEYCAMTCFIWPETWQVREDLPPVDAALEPCVKELLKGVAELKMRAGAVKCFPVKEFPVDLRILEQSFSGIFQASQRSREKTKIREDLYEADLRHDHDRLLFDFFIRLVEQRKRDTLMDSQSIAFLEDPNSRPTLETTLRFPKSDNLRKRDQEKLQRSILPLINHSPTDLVNWLKNRGCPEPTDLEEADNILYVYSQWSNWRRETNREAEDQMISQLGRLPSTGRCDALGRLLVELPSVARKDVRHLQLVVHPARKRDAGKGESKVEALASGPKARRDLGKASTMTSNSLAVPDAAFGTTEKMDGTQYDMLSSSTSTSASTQSLDDEQTSSIDSLANGVQQIRLGAGATHLELPILTVENKRASDGAIKGTNQLRMYLTASVKFLHAIGITNIPVYGVQTDGPIVVLPVAILRDDNFVYLFERLVERIDISTPVGAWHYATILCRLAGNHASALEKKFEGVRDKLVASLLCKENQAEEWTIDHQMARLKAEGRAKSPPRERSRK